MNAESASRRSSVVECAAYAGPNRPRTYGAAMATMADDTAVSASERGRTFQKSWERWVGAFDASAKRLRASRAGMAVSSGTVRSGIATHVAARAPWLLATRRGVMAG